MTCAFLRLTAVPVFCCRSFFPLYNGNGSQPGISNILFSSAEEGKREPSARLADLATDDEVSQVRGLREKVQKGCGAMALANGRHRPPSSGSLGVLSLVATPSRPPHLQTVLRNPTEPEPAGELGSLLQSAPLGL